MQEKRLYVGNLNYATTEEELKELFQEHGTVESVNIINRKGFGFVEMSSLEEAENAMNSLNNKEFMGRALKVDEAKPRRERT